MSGEEDYAATVIANVAQVVAEIRTAKHMSQAALAKKAGVSIQQVSTLETAAGNPTLRTLVAFAVGLEVDVADLFRSPSGGETRLHPGRPRKD